MTTTVATRAAATFPVFQPQGAGNLACAYGVYPVTANPTAADLLQMCRLPAGAVVVGGFVRAEDIDTGSGTLDFDLGWAANGGTGTYDAVSTAGFGNFGARNGTAVTNYLPEGGSMLPLHGTLASAGVINFTKETILQIVFNVAANAFTAGTIAVVVFYLVP